MPTLAQIEAQPTSALSSIEKESVRRVLAISGQAGSTLYNDSEARMSALTNEQKQEVRAWLSVWDDIGDSTAYMSGGKDAIHFDPEKDRQLVREAMMRILYHTGAFEEGDSDGDESQFSNVVATFYGGYGPGNCEY